MHSMLHENVIGRPSFEASLSARLAAKLHVHEIKEASLRETFNGIMREAPEISERARADVAAVYERDPACTSYLQPLLFFKGFMALQASRFAHALWTRDRKPLAQFIQMRVSEVFGVDIHPGARIGKGIMIDHATSIVIGETAVIEDDVSMLHSVTLGGTGKEGGDRHPKIGRGVLIGAGAHILGNIRIGEQSRIGAGSVVLHNVPPCKTVAGVPARVVGDAGCAHPSHSMDHTLSVDDAGV
ncbi:UNVERIFIED_CONTAM: hypothetical protein GTU68_021942 [Idotea baltica]|nr:hypothetical protein [Idotea baltica]